jgi:hypothetical protein
MSMTHDEIKALCGVSPDGFVPRRTPFSRQLIYGMAAPQDYRIWIARMLERGWIDLTTYVEPQMAIGHAAQLLPVEPQMAIGHAAQLLPVEHKLLLSDPEAALDQIRRLYVSAYLESGRWEFSEPRSFWVGTVDRHEPHGVAIVSYSFGRMWLVSNVLLPDEIARRIDGGGNLPFDPNRGSVDRGLWTRDNTGDRDEIPDTHGWRMRISRRSDGSSRMRDGDPRVLWGRIEIDPGRDVRFVVDDACRPPNELWGYDLTDPYRAGEDLGRDALRNPEIVRKLREDEGYVRRFQSAIRFHEWRHPEMSADFDCYSLGWRQAARVVSDLRNFGEEYMDWAETTAGVERSEIEDVIVDFKAMGWALVASDSEG